MGATEAPMTSGLGRDGLGLDLGARSDGVIQAGADACGDHGGT